MGKNVFVCFYGQSKKNLLTVAWQRRSSAYSSCRPSWPYILLPLMSVYIAWLGRRTCDQQVASSTLSRALSG